MTQNTAVVEVQRHFYHRTCKHAPTPHRRTNQVGTRKARSTAPIMWTGIPLGVRGKEDLVAHLALEAFGSDVSEFQRW